MSFDTCVIAIQIVNTSRMNGDGYSTREVNKEDCLRKGVQRISEISYTIFKTV